MDDRDTIRRRVIDLAVSLFNEKNQNGDGLFTTAHYGQAMKAEFKTPGPTIDSEPCARHLLQMGDIVEKAGSNLWRRKMRLGDPAQVGTIIDDEIYNRHGAEIDVEIGVKVESEVMDVLSDKNAIGAGGATPWWTVGLMAAALHHIEEKYDLEGGLLENMVGIILYTMAVDGRVVAQPNMMMDGTRATIFTLAPKNVDVMRPPFEGW